MPSDRDMYRDLTPVESAWIGRALAPVYFASDSTYRAICNGPCISTDRWHGSETTNPSRAEREGEIHVEAEHYCAWPNGRAPAAAGKTQCI